MKTMIFIYLVTYYFISRYTRFKLICCIAAFFFGTHIDFDEECDENALGTLEQDVADIIANCKAHEIERVKEELEELRQEKIRRGMLPPDPVPAPQSDAAESDKANSSKLEQFAYVVRFLQDIQDLKKYSQTVASILDDLVVEGDVAVLKTYATFHTYH